MCFVLCLVLYNILHEHVIVKKTIDIVFIAFCDLCRSDERASTQQKCLHSTSAIAVRASATHRPGGWVSSPACFPSLRGSACPAVALFLHGHSGRAAVISDGPVHFISHVAVKLRSLNIWGENGACSKRFLPLP